MPVRRLLVPAVALAVVACAQAPAASPPPMDADTPGATAPAAPTPTGEPTVGPTGAPVLVAPPAEVLRGDRRNIIVYAPLGHPERLTRFGTVVARHQQAWSTSKVLVVLAYLDVRAAGDPRVLDSGERRLIAQALRASDLTALLTLRAGIHGGSGAAITRILRSVGDRRTTAPDTGESSMRWSPRQQVRFLVALSQGRVVSPRASRYVVRMMRPIRAHRWGLGRIGATAFKGGWLTPTTNTRQMGLVPGYAVAIMTDAVGPAVLQTDGDFAHVRQLTALARLLRRQLDYEQAN